MYLGVPLGASKFIIFSPSSKSGSTPSIRYNDDSVIMATGKNHSIKHTPGDVARYGDAINVSCEAPEEAHKDWVKKTRCLYQSRA